MTSSRKQKNGPCRSVLFLPLFLGGGEEGGFFGGLLFAFGRDFTVSDGGGAFERAGGAGGDADALVADFNRLQIDVLLAFGGDIRMRARIYREGALAGNHADAGHRIARKVSLKREFCKGAHV